MPWESVLSFPSSSRLFVVWVFFLASVYTMQGPLSMHKMPKKITETFTNTFDRKCAIIVFVGASKELSMSFYYTYIYREKAAVHEEQSLFCVKNFLIKDF